MSEEHQKKSFSVPAHIAIIMDGNGRWAKQRGLPRNVGHKQGAKAFEIWTGQQMPLDYVKEHF